LIRGSAGAEVARSCKSEPSSDFIIGPPLSHGPRQGDIRCPTCLVHHRHHRVQWSVPLRQGSESQEPRLGSVRRKHRRWTKVKLIRRRASASGLDRLPRRCVELSARRVCTARAAGRVLWRAPPAGVRRAARTRTSSASRGNSSSTITSPRGAATPCPRVRAARMGYGTRRCGQAPVTPAFDHVSG
jgi:hypothetical protein